MAQALNSPELTSGVATEGILASPDAENLYQFKMPGPGYVKFDFGPSPLNADSDKIHWGWDIYIYAKDNISNGSQLQGFTGVENDVHSCEIPYYGDGTLFIQIKNYSASSSWATETYYSLKATYTAADNWETEANDTMADADELACGTGGKYGTEAIGAMFTKGDVDWYKVTVPSSGWFSFKLKPSDYCDADLIKWGWNMSVYDADAQLLDEYTGITAEKESYKFPYPAGTYYVKIESNQKSDSFAPIRAFYSLQAASYKTSYREKEANNSTETANKISLGKNYYGALWEDDTDYYKFTLDKPGAVNIKLALYNNDANLSIGWGWDVKLYKKDSTVVINKATDITASGDFYAVLGKGTYYISVTPNWSSYAPLYIDYKLSTAYYQAPAKPVWADAVTASTGVKLSWAKVDGATGYVVERRTGSSGAWTAVKTLTKSTSLSYTDTGMDYGTKYQYRVLAYNKYSDNVGSASLTKSVYRLAKPTVSVSNLSTGIKVSWKKVDGATGYIVERKKGSSTAWTAVKTITKSTTLSFTDTDVSNGTKYQYRVFAVNSTTKNQSLASKTKTEYRLSRPAISSLSNSTAGSMSVKWGKNSSASGYQVKYKVGSSTKTVTVSGASSVSKLISGLTKGKTYTVYVRSYKTVNSVKYYSAWSASKTLAITK